MTKNTFVAEVAFKMIHLSKVNSRVYIVHRRFEPPFCQQTPYPTTLSSHYMAIPSFYLFSNLFLSFLPFGKTFSIILPQ